MSEIPTDLSDDRIVRTLKKAGFEIISQGKHISMAKGEGIVIIPRHKRIKREIVRSIIKDAGLSVDEFKNLL